MRINCKSFKYRRLHCFGPLVKLKAGYFDSFLLLWSISRWCWLHEIRLARAGGAHQVSDLHLLPSITYLHLPLSLQHSHTASGGLAQGWCLLHCALSGSGDLEEGRKRQTERERRSRAGKVRTVLTEKQLNILKTCFSANPRPDALMKEQLTEMTGLSARVVRVWFQNKRCKEKKKMREATKVSAELHVKTISKR